MHFGQQRPAFRDVLRGRRAAAETHFGDKCRRGQPQLFRQRFQHRRVGDAPAFLIVCLLNAVQHVQPASRQLFRRQDSGNRRLGIHHRRGVAQQAVEIGFAKRLARHLGDAFVVRNDVVAPFVGDLAAVVAGHHAAGVRHDLQPGRL